MNEQGNNFPFRPNHPDDSQCPNPLHQLFGGGQVERIFLSPVNDDTIGNAGMHVTTMHSTNFFFNNPGQYSFSVGMGNGVFSGPPQVPFDQFTRNGPTTSVSVAPTAPISTTAGSFGMLSTGATATTTSPQNRGGSTSFNGNGNCGTSTAPPSSSTEPPRKFFPSPNENCASAKFNPVHD